MAPSLAKFWVSSSRKILVQIGKVPKANRWTLTTSSNVFIVKKNKKQEDKDLN